MFFRMLESCMHSAFGASRSGKIRRHGAAMDESEPERAGRLDRAHGAAPTDAHLDIIFGGLRIGEHDLLQLVRNCVAGAGATVPPRKVFHRPLASYFLARYFLHSLSVEGLRAECGVFMGISALLLCRTAQTREPAYAGRDLHLIDSFQGLDEPGDKDASDTPEGPMALAPGKGAYAASLERVRSTLEDFPQVSYHEGWIPEVFGQLPATQWSFVHIDVDHYKPTYASLAYFYPRLSKRGVIISDDYGAALYPGAHRAWDSYCDENEVPYIVLDTGQSVILKT